MEFIKQNLFTIVIFSLLVIYILYQRIPIYFANKKMQEKDIQNLTFKTLNDEMYTINDFKNKTILINFWATWCLPCKLEMPILESLHQEMKEDLEILGITNESKEVVYSYLKDKSINYKIVIDSEYQLANYFDIRGYPTIILIKNKKIKDVSTGFNPLLKWKIKWFIKGFIF